MQPGLPGLEQPLADQAPWHAGAGGGLPAIVAEAAYGEALTEGLAEVGGLHVGGQPEAQLIDEGLPRVEGTLMQHPGLQLHGGGTRLGLWHQGARSGGRRNGQRGRLFGAEGQGRHLAGTGLQQVKRDLPADQAAHLGIDAADADPAYRKLTQQGEQAELVALELPVGFDDEQPVAIILPRQQLGARGGRLHLSGLYLGGQQHGEQPAAA